MIMHNSYCGVVEREIITVDSAREVNILGVHEIAFVEKPRLLHRLRAQLHEATAQVWYIHRTRIVRIVQLIACIALAHPSGRQEPPAEHIQWSGEHLT